MIARDRSIIAYCIGVSFIPCQLLDAFDSAGIAADSHEYSGSACRHYDFTDLTCASFRYRIFAYIDALRKEIQAPECIWFALIDMHIAISDSIVEENEAGIAFI